MPLLFVEQGCLVTNVHSAMDIWVIFSSRAGGVISMQQLILSLNCPLRCIKDFLLLLRSYLHVYNHVECNLTAESNTQKLSMCRRCPTVLSIWTFSFPIWMNASEYCFSSTGSILQYVTHLMLLNFLFGSIILKNFFTCEFVSYSSYAIFIEAPVKRWK